MAYNYCNECPHYKKDSCPLQALSDRLKQQVCPFLKLRLIDNTPIDEQVDRLAASIQKRLKAIQKMLDPAKHPVEYTRNDTCTIAKNFDPNLN
jgi:hypothetical protein